MKLTPTAYNLHDNGHAIVPKPEWACASQDKGLHLRKGETAINVDVDWNGSAETDLAYVSLGVYLFRKSWINRLAHAQNNVSRFFGTVYSSGSCLDEWVTFITPHSAYLRGDNNRFDFECNVCKQKIVFPSKVGCLEVEAENEGVVGTSRGLFVQKTIWDKLQMEVPKGSFSPEFLSKCS